jgi:hypothetical protein
MAAEPALPPRRRALWAGVAALVGIVAAAGMAVGLAQRDRPLLLERPTEQAHQIQQLLARCAADMVAQTCRVMQGPTTSLIPSDAQTVFVAGLGPMPAELYRQLREQGEGMCLPLRAACEQDWSGQTCRTARTLYGAQA